MLFDLDRMMIEVLLFSAVVSSAFSTTTREAPWTPDPLCPFPAPDEYFYFPVPGDCTRYIQCFNGDKYEFQCSDDLWWHQEILACDYPGPYCDPNTTATYSTTTSTNTTWTSTTSTTTAPPITSTTTQPTTTQRPGPGPDPRCSDDSTSYWPHPVFCNRYIECYMGNSYEMSCPPGLYFSGNKTQCVSREESECCETNTTC